MNVLSANNANNATTVTSQAFAEQLRGRGEQVNRQASLPKASDGASPELREAFDDFVGQTFYGLMLKTMRESVGKTPYFDGGRGEEVFSKQLDQLMVEQMSDASADTFTGPMFELFNMRRM